MFHLYITHQYGTTIVFQSPQVFFPLSRYIYPSDPHVLAQEFLTIVAVDVNPTARTAWLRLSPH